MNHPRQTAAHLPPTAPHARHPGPIDLETVTTLIYLAGMDPALWHQLGPERVALFVARTHADPRLRVPELVALVTTALACGQGLADYHAQARAFAPSVLAALTRTTATAAH